VAVTVLPNLPTSHKESNGEVIRAIGVQENGDTYCCNDQNPTLNP